jgi:hypothetical protein
VWYAPCLWSRLGARRGGFSQTADRCLYPQSNAHYGQHDRYAYRPLSGVVIDQGYDYGGDNKYAADDLCRAPWAAGLAHSSLLRQFGRLKILARGLRSVNTLRTSRA